MKKLLMLCAVIFSPVVLHAENAKVACGSNIKSGIVVCYTLKNYNKNPKISLDFDKAYDENPENGDWSIHYNLKAVLAYTVVAKQNNQITFTRNYEGMDYLDSEYDVYYYIMQTNNKTQSDLLSAGINTKIFYPQYSNQLSQIIQKYKNADKNEFEIKKSEYIISSLTPLLKLEVDKLNKIENKRNSILGDSLNNYINSIKAKSDQDNNNNVKKISDSVEEINQAKQDINTQIEALKAGLENIKTTQAKIDEIDKEQGKLENEAKNRNGFTKLFNNVSGKTLMLNNINQIIKENTKNIQSAIDLFSGSGVVGNFFKESGYQTVSNDVLYFSFILSRGILCLNHTPKFKTLGIKNPIEYLNNLKIEDTKINIQECFIYQNYSPVKNNNRMYFQSENAKKIDIIRITIENWKNEIRITEDEYFYLLAILISAVPYISIILQEYMGLI